MVPNRLKGFYFIFIYYNRGQKIEFNKILDKKSKEEKLAKKLPYTSSTTQGPQGPKVIHYLDTMMGAGSLKRENLNRVQHSQVRHAKKVSFSEKATKICAICLMILTLT